MKPSSRSTNLSGRCIIHRIYLPSSIMQSKSLTIHTHTRTTKSRETPDDNKAEGLLKVATVSSCEKRSPYLTGTWDSTAGNGAEVIYSSQPWILSGEGGGVFFCTRSSSNASNRLHVVERRSVGILEENEKGPGRSSIQVLDAIQTMYEHPPTEE